MVEDCTERLGGSGWQGAGTKEDSNVDSRFASDNFFVNFSMRFLAAVIASLYLSKNL